MSDSDSPLDRASPEAYSGFIESTVRCIKRFLLDNEHSQSPIVHGPCDACIREVADEMTVADG